MPFKFKAGSEEEAKRFDNADTIAKKLGGAIAALSDKGDQLIARVLFNCPRWHTDPTMIAYPGHKTAIQVLGERELITIRRHYADRYPAGIQAFEITDKGLDVVAEMLGEELAQETLRQRTWYQQNSSYDAWMTRVRTGFVKKALIDAKTAP